MSIETLEISNKINSIHPKAILYYFRSKLDRNPQVYYKQNLPNIFILEETGEQFQLFDPSFTHPEGNIPVFFLRRNYPFSLKMHFRGNYTINRETLQEIMKYEKAKIENPDLEIPEKLQKFTKCALVEDNYSATELDANLNSHYTKYLLGRDIPKAYWILLLVAFIMGCFLVYSVMVTINPLPVKLPTNTTITLGRVLAYLLLT